MPPSEAIRAKREAIVVEHMGSENRHEFDATLETFDYPRGLPPTGRAFEIARQLTGR